MALTLTGTMGMARPVKHVSVAADTAKGGKKPPASIIFFTRQAKGVAGTTKGIAPASTAVAPAAAAAPATRSKKGTAALIMVKPTPAKPATGN